MSVARLFAAADEDLADHYPNRAEHLADGIVHAVGLAAAAVGGAVLIGWALHKGGAAQAVGPGLYALCLIAMLTCSAVYNLTRPSPARRVLRRLDEAAIFLMIAGSYTPFTAHHLEGAATWIVTGFVWLLAVAGVIGKLFFVTLSERFWSGAYVAFGWLSVIIMAPLAGVLPWWVLVLLAAGGIIYTAGVSFFLAQNMPFRRAVWHGFVVAGAAFHYTAVLASVAAV